METNPWNDDVVIKLCHPITKNVTFYYNEQKPMSVTCVIMTATVPPIRTPRLLKNQLSKLFSQPCHNETYKSAKYFNLPTVDI